VPGWVTAAIVIPVVTFAAVATARWVGRWFTKAMHDTFTAAVNEVVAPPIDRHLADHDLLSARLATVEELAVDLERRVTAIESALRPWREPPQ
jgi:hypothetical protein